jgi:hypothetical protein
MSDEAPNPEEAIPKTFIRKKLLELVNIAESADEKVRVLEALSKLEGYVGPGSQGSHRKDMKAAVQIVQTSKYTLERPKVPPGLARRKVTDPPPAADSGT